MDRESDETVLTLPDGAIARVFTLASAQFRRDDLARIAGGEDPASFPMPAGIEPVWGLFYACDDRSGLYVHPYQSQLDQLFRGPNARALTDIDLRFPHGETLSLEIKRDKPRHTSLGRFFARISAKPRAKLTIKWKVDGNERSIVMFALRDTDAVIEALRAKIGISELFQ